MSYPISYKVGQSLLWVPYSRHKQQEIVKVEALRKGGGALLSNGWVVDSEGDAEGTSRIPGGSVQLSPVGYAEDCVVTL